MKRLLNLVPTFLLLLILPGFRFTCTEPTVENLPRVNLQWWGVWDQTEHLQPIINDFRSVHPNVTVNYRKFRPEEYERQLLAAFAEDRAPDLLALPNNAVRRHQTKLQNMPESIKLPTLKIQGTIKQETIVETQTMKTPSLQQIREQFLDVVADDAIVDNKLYGFPLATDILALYYNRDLLAQAGIPSPPTTWVELQSMAGKLTKLDPKGEILLSAISFGTARNIPQVTDIIALLMMQNGAIMTTRNGDVMFHLEPPLWNESLPPGAQALEFYTDFANPKKQAYTWNDRLPSAFDAFASGRVAFYIGYAFHGEILSVQAPQLNWDIAPIPQVDPARKVNFARYTLVTINKKTKYPNEAWGLVLTALKDKPVAEYLKRTQQPPALRTLIASQTSHPAQVFAQGLLTAKSWYRGQDPEAADRIFSDMTTSVVDGQRKPQEAVEQAAGKIQQTKALEVP